MSSRGGNEGGEHLCAGTRAQLAPPGPRWPGSKLKQALTLGARGRDAAAMPAIRDEAGADANADAEALGAIAGEQPAVSG